MRKIAVAIILALGLAACSTTSDPMEETRGWTVEKLYSEAHDEMISANYTRAIKLYEALEARFPYGRYAQQAQMDLAYTHYKDQEPALALAACDTFIKMYPTHPNVDYIYYLKGLINYSDDGGLFSKYTGQDRAERDPKTARESFLAFQELVKRYPNSRYAPDAVAKMNTLVDGLAAHELFVARYYMRRQAYLAAVNRAQAVLKDFSNTQYVEESMAIMVAGYDALKLPVLRDDSRRILQANYPNSPYLVTQWMPKRSPWYQFW